MNPQVQGNLGQTPLVVDQDTGVLTLGGRQIILMRVKLIARLFADIMKFGMTDSLLHDAGKAMGKDYTTDWLLMRTPIMQGNLRLPPDIAQLGQQYEQLEDQIDAGVVDPQVLAREHEIASRIHEGLDRWTPQLSEQDIGNIWRQLLELDILGGWGKAQLVRLDRARPRAEIDVIASFAVRPANIWHQHGIKGRPVCAFLAGYLAGEAEILLGRDDLDAVERQCKLQGASTCRFEIIRQGSASLLK